MSRNLSIQDIYADALVTILAFVPRDFLNVTRFVCRNWNHVIKERLKRKKRIIRLHDFVKYNNIDILEWALKNGCSGKNIICCMAASLGNVEILDWAITRSFPLDFKSKSITEDVLSMYKLGHFDRNRIFEGKNVKKSERIRMLQENFRNGTIHLFKSVPCAARNGHIRVLEWAKKRFHYCGIEEIRAGIVGNRMHVLEWIMKNGCVGIDKKDYVTCSLATGERLEILQWLRKNGWNWNERVCSGAARKGDLETLKWAIDSGCPWNNEICHDAALGGHLEILKWTIEKGCQWNNNTARVAALGGHLHILKWARENNLTLGSAICLRAAAHRGHLHILKWMKENGLFVDENICLEAAEGGHLQVMQWARENDCKWEAQVCNVAAEQGHFDLLKWLRENGCPYDESTLEMSLISGNNKNVSRHRDNNYSGFTEIGRNTAEPPPFYIFAIVQFGFPILVAIALLILRPHITSFFER